MPATLYATFGSGNSFKPALLLRQTGKACVTKNLNVLAGESRQPGFLAINPRGQIPFLVLEDGRGIAESNTMAWWVAEGTPLMPADVAVYGYTHLAAEGGFDLARFTQRGRWMQRVQQSPGYEPIAQLLKA